MKNVLITGATGLLGGALVPEAQRRHLKLAALYHRDRSSLKSPYVQCDLTDSAALQRLLSQTKPGLIIHSAAATDVDRCEIDPPWCKGLNVQATQTLAEWSKECGARMVYISTDSVFDGSLGQYKEQDEVRPLNAYAKSKYEGEQVVRSLVKDHAVLRTNFYGWGNGDRLSLGEWVLRSYLRQEPIKTFTDVKFSPLHTTELAEIVFDLALGGAQGTFHVGSRDSCSKHEFAMLVSKVFGLISEVIPVSVDTFQFRAARPKDTSFHVEKVTRDLGRPMPSLLEGMKKFKARYDSGNISRDTSQWHVSSI